MASRRRDHVAVAVALVTAVGCGGGVLGDRAVHIVRPIDGPVGEPDRPNRRLVALPVPGATPVAIVRGFLDAQADPEGGYAAARQYLEPRTPWQPAAGTTVYSGTLALKTESTTPDRVVLSVRGTRQATISAAGEWSAASGMLSQRYTVVRVRGEWRLNQVVNGLTVTPDDLARGYRLTVLYFLNRQESRLVRQRLYLPREDLSTEQLAVRALLRGPAGRTGVALRTAVPERTELIAVNVTGGVAEVDLSREINDAPPRALPGLLAQVVWTLTEIPGIGAVRLSVEGDQLPGVSSDAPLRRDIAGRLDPD